MADMGEESIQIPEADNMVNFTDDLLLQMFQQNASIIFEENILHTDENLRMLFIVFYAIVITMGTLENILVLITIVRNGHFQNVTNIFIASLAVSDIVLCIFNLPLQLHYQLTDYWVFGQVLCRVIMPMFGAPIFYSTMCMMIIAVHRYSLIVHPFRKKITKKMAVLIITVTVFFTFGLSTPVMVHMHYDIINIPEVDVHKIFCFEKWPKYGALTYSIFVFFLQFLLPFVVTAILYFKIHRVLQQRPPKRSEVRQTNRTNKILLATLIMSAISWLPWNIFTVIISVNHQAVNGPYFKMADLSLNLVALSSACINPFIYGWLNDNFQNCYGAMSKKNRKQEHKNNCIKTQAVGNQTTAFIV